MSNRAVHSSLDVLIRSHQLLTTVAASVDENTLSAPTPCGDWDVSALLDHVTGGNRFTVEILGGAEAEAALVTAIESFAAEHDVVAAVVESSAVQLKEFEAPGCLTGTYHHMHGELSGDAALRLRVHDVSVHIWDLMQALSPGSPLDAVYVEWAIAELAMSDSIAKHHMASGLVQPTTADELLIAFGRDEN